MFKKVKRTLNCFLCNTPLINPVVMSCGKSICKKHLKELITNGSNFKNNLLSIIIQNELSFQKDGQSKTALDLELNQLEQSRVFNECKQEIDIAKENVVKIEVLENNSEIYIYDYFEDIKRQVDLRREELKLKIDDHSDEVIKSVQITQLHFFKLSKDVNHMTTNIGKSKQQLKELMGQFDTLNYSYNKFKEIKASVAVVNKEFHEIIADYQDSLVGNKKHTFKFDELSIDEIFGRYTTFEVNFFE